MANRNGVVQNDFDFFPTPVSVINLGEESRPLNKQIMDAVWKEKEASNKQQRTGINIFQSFYNLEKKHKIFADLQKVFMDLCKPAIARAGFGGNLDDYLCCEEFWMNVCETPYGYNVPHNHGMGRTLWAGVYYPTSGIQNGVSISEKQNLNDNFQMEATSMPKPGSLVLHDPAFAIKSQVGTSHPAFNKYPYYGLSVSIQPKEGTLVIFPAWLVHSVTPTEKENFTRVSIAFSINKK